MSKKTYPTLDYLSVIVRAWEAWGFPSTAIQRLIYGLSKVAQTRPDLVERYVTAIKQSNSLEIERLLGETESELSLLVAMGLVSAGRQPFFSNICINHATRSLHLGAMHSLPLFSN